MKPLPLISAMLATSLTGIVPERTPAENERLYGTKRNPGKPVPVVRFDIPEPKRKKKAYGARKMTKRERKAGATK